MDGIKDLLSSLLASRTLAAAVCVTAGLVHFGPRLWPTMFDPIPKDWAWAPVIAFGVSATLLLVRLLAGIWSVISDEVTFRSDVRLFDALSTTPLDELQQRALVYFGETGGSIIYFPDFQRRVSDLTNIEFDSLVQGLVQLKLVLTHGSSIRLTNLGLQRAKAIGDLHPDYYGETAGPRSARARLT